MFPYANPDDYAQRLAPLAEEDGVMATYILYRVTPEDVELVESGMTRNYAKQEAAALASQDAGRPVRLKWQRVADDLEQAATSEGYGFYVEKYQG